MARPKIAQQRDQVVAIVVGVGHQVAAAHVEPLDAVEITAEMPLYGFERLAEMLRPRFAQHMEMQPLDPVGQTALRFQLLGGPSQPRTRHAGVVKIGLHGRIARVDAQTARDAAQQRHCAETAELSERIEGDMAAAIEYLADIAVGVDRSIRVRRLPELFAYQPGLGGRTGRRAVAVTRQQGEDTPHGARFERDDHLGARLAAHAVDDRKIPRQQTFVQQKTGRGSPLEINHSLFKELTCKYTLIS